MRRWMVRAGRDPLAGKGIGKRGGGKDGQRVGK
jgi:hypothetical protein